MTPPPTNAKVFEHTSLIRTTLEALTDFHADPKAFSRLTPPPIFAQIHRRELVSLTQGELEFTLWFGPLPIRWLAEHQPSVNAHSFADYMQRGPMAYWRHEHIIEPQGDAVRLTDRITLAHKSGFDGLLTRLMFDGLPLRFLFIYRHLRTKWATQNA